MTTGERPTQLARHGAVALRGRVASPEVDARLLLAHVIGIGPGELILAAEALTETFVGDRPSDPVPTPLPPPARAPPPGPSSIVSTPPKRGTTTSVV